MKPKRELQDIMRDIRNLDLQRMNGTIGWKEYERRRSVLDAEWRIPAYGPSVLSVPTWVTETKPLTLDDFNKMAGKMYTGVDVGDGEMTTVTMKIDNGILTVTDSTTKSDGAILKDAWNKWTKWANSGSFYSYGAQMDSNLAQQVWDECEGVVMCECENMDCMRRIDITRDEYIKASSPGNARLTHPDCSYGIVNSKLIHRTPKWNIWWKGDQPGW